MRRLFGLLFSLFSSFCLAQVSVTIDLQPSGARAPVNVSGANCQPGQYLAPVQLTWTPGPACQVALVLPYAAAPGTRLALVSWDDQSSTSAISIPVPAASLTRTANLRYEYQVTTASAPPSAASVTPGGWYASGTKATVQATANPNQLFLYWAISSSCASVLKPQPLIIECQVDRPVTLAATFRATTAPMPRRFTVTAIPALSASAGGALTAGGAVAAYVEGAGGRSVYLWQPEKPNSAMGLAAEIASLSNRTATWVVRINDTGRLAYSVGPQFKMAIWTPSAPGSVTGTEAILAEPSNLIAGYPGGFNRFGQIAAMLTSGSGLWTPASAGATGGTTLKDVRFASVQCLNDFGQVLSEAASGGSTPPLGFTVFTPNAANSAAGMFTSVTPLGATSTSTHTINAGGMVAGTYCTTPVGMACQPRAFLWQPSAPNSGTGTATDIAPPPGFPGVSSIAVMNSAGDMAGSLVVNSYQTTAFLRTGGVFYDLNQIPGVPMLSQALGLNDAGQILLTNGNSQGLLLLTPQPAAPPPGANSVPVTISASAAGIGFAVTGAGCQPGDYNAPSTLQWTPGASCQVRWLDMEFSGPQQRRAFAGWNDGQAANPRTFTVPASATSYTANFSDEVYVTTVAEPPQGGTASGSGWYPVNSSVTIVAAPAPGYRFGYWENLSYLDGATTHVTVDSQHRYFKAFFAITTPLPFTYTVTAIGGMGPDNGRLNNLGQVVSGRSGSAPNVTLWTPAQPNGTAGVVTGLERVCIRWTDGFSADAVHQRPGAVYGNTSQSPSPTLVAIHAQWDAGRHIDSECACQRLPLHAEAHQFLRPDLRVDAKQAGLLDPDDRQRFNGEPRCPARQSYVPLFGERSRAGSGGRTELRQFCGAI
ncbi:MAG: hypothetical protein IPP47_04535 [Bryobacterales bacterium]|nr:hypothetical protein [Bryobacterales bacterium]